MGGVLSAEGGGINGAEEDGFVGLGKRSTTVVTLQSNGKGVVYCISYSLALGITGYGRGLAPRGRRLSSPYTFYRMIRLLQRQTQMMPYQRLQTSFVQSLRRLQDRVTAGK